MKAVMKDVTAALPGKMQDFFARKNINLGPTKLAPAPWTDVASGEQVGNPNEGPR